MRVWVRVRWFPVGREVGWEVGGKEAGASCSLHRKRRGGVKEAAENMGKVA